jgi:hypothetical protein
MSAAIDELNERISCAVASLEQTNYFTSPSSSDHLALRGTFGRSPVRCVEPREALPEAGCGAGNQNRSVLSAVFF